MTSRPGSIPPSSPKRGRFARALHGTVEWCMQTSRRIRPDGRRAGHRCRDACDDLEQQKAHSRAAFDTFADKARIPRASVSSSTATRYSRLRTSRKVGANLVVMGAVSRSGLNRIFIGNTAERVLDDLPCDVLVVKPGRLCLGWPPGCAGYEWCQRNRSRRRRVEWPQSDTQRRSTRTCTPLKIPCAHAICPGIVGAGEFASRYL